MQTAGEHKRVLAQRVSYLLSNDVSEQERVIAEDIARVLVTDVALAVRKTLAQELAASDRVPRDIAMKLAQDEDVVASPFLEQTCSLSDEDFMELIPIVGEFARVAIAKRPHVSADVGMAVVKFGNDDTVSVLVKNPGSDMSAGVCDAIMQRSTKDHPNLHLLARREDLPMEVVSDLAHSISGIFLQQLAANFNMSVEELGLVESDIHPSAVAGYYAEIEPDGIRQHVKKMHSMGVLTPDLILSNLRQGNIEFFHAALAELIGSDAARVSEVLRNSAAGIMDNLLSRAQIPRIYWKRIKDAYPGKR